MAAKRLGPGEVEDFRTLFPDQGALFQGAPRTGGTPWDPHALLALGGHEALFGPGSDSKGFFVHRPGFLAPGGCGRGGPISQGHCLSYSCIPGRNCRLRPPKEG
jgi:hypothetical protein